MLPCGHLACSLASIPHTPWRASRMLPGEHLVHLRTKHLSALDLTPRPLSKGEGQGERSGLKIIYQRCKISPAFSRIVEREIIIFVPDVLHARFKAKPVPYACKNLGVHNPVAGGVAPSLV